VKHIIDALLQDIKIQSSKRNYCYELWRFWARAELCPTTWLCMLHV
jgi:hypothetical protein